MKYSSVPYNSVSFNSASHNLVGERPRTFFVFPPFVLLGLMSFLPLSGVCLMPTKAVAEPARAGLSRRGHHSWGAERIIDLNNEGELAAQAFGFEQESAKEQRPKNQDSLNEYALEYDPYLGPREPLAPAPLSAEDQDWEENLVGQASDFSQSLNSLAAYCLNRTREFILGSGVAHADDGREFSAKPLGYRPASLNELKARLDEEARHPRLFLEKF